MSVADADSAFLVPPSAAEDEVVQSCDSDRCHSPELAGVGTRRKVGVDSSCMAGSSQSVAPAASSGAAVG